jgi:non-ribosomal peptide synthetase component F
MLSAFLQVAWAMVLSYHTGMHNVCFGYMASGRDAPVDGVETLVGPLANLLISRVDLGAPARQVLQTTSTRVEQHLAIQNVSMAEILHRLGLSGRRLFNTSLSIRYAAKNEAGPKRGLSFQTLSSEDAHEV